MPVTLASLRRAIAQGPAAVRSLAWPEPHATPTETVQRGLWIVDADGLPPRPWLICGNSEVRCATLGCTVMARVCVARQAASDSQRTRDTWRGQGFDYPNCVTERCAQGRAVRDALDPTRLMRWRGAGPGGRFDRGRKDAPQQYEARVRLERVGLLDAVPTVDAEPVAVEPDGDGEARSQATYRQPERQPEPAASASRASLEAGAEREPVGPPERVRGLREALPGGGRSGRVSDADGRDGVGRVRASSGARRGDHAGVRVGQAEAGRGAQRSERRARGVSPERGDRIGRDGR